MAPTCLQTFFSPSNFKIKKGIKKKKKREKTKQKKDFHRKENYFQNEDMLLQSSGIEQCCCIILFFGHCCVLFLLLFSSSSSKWRKLCDHYLAHGGRCLRKAGFPEEQLHTISCIFKTQLLALKILLKNKIK